MSQWFPDRSKRKGGGGIPGRDPVERFQEKISHTDENGCHIWGGAVQTRGYGSFCWGGKGKTILAHRWAFIYLGKNDIPDDLVIDHVCRNRLCVNPEHMRVVTNKENVLAGESFAAVNAVKTHCRRGHSLENAIPDGRVKRRCVECRRIHNRKHRRKKYWESRGGEANRKRAPRVSLKEAT